MAPFIWCSILDSTLKFNCEFDLNSIRNRIAQTVYDASLAGGREEA